MPNDQLERLRAALAGSDEAPPRPLSLLDLDDDVADQLFTPQWLEGLRPAAVLTPILLREDGASILLTRRADHLRTHRGQVSFPGGRRDAGDASALANALREAEEEIGLAPEHVEVLGYLDDYPTFTGFRITPVVGLIREAPDWRLDPGEVAEAFELPLHVALDPARYRRVAFERDGLSLHYYEMDFAPQRVWGVTAGMLWQLCRRVTEQP